MGRCLAVRLFRLGVQGEAERPERRLCSTATLCHRLENPPLLVVSDMDPIIIHTNFTNTVQQIHTIALEELERSETLALLRRLFTDPESFRPVLPVRPSPPRLPMPLSALPSVSATRGTTATASPT